MRLVILIYYLSHPWRLDSKHDLTQRKSFCACFRSCFLFFGVCVFFMRDSPHAFSKLLPRAFHASNRRLCLKVSVCTPRLAFDDADRNTTLNSRYL